MAKTMSKVQHLIVNWNSSEDFCLDTIREHSKIIDSSVEKYVWYGKMVKTNPTKNNISLIEKLNSQIQKDIPTYLFLFAPNDQFGRRLHVGLIKEVTSEYPNEKNLIPPHYHKVPYQCSYWFKISDFKQLSFEWYQHLICQNGQTFDPVASNNYPIIITLRNNIDIFDYTKTDGRKWYAFQLLHTTTPSINRTNKQVFVIMPFNKKFNDVYNLGIKSTLEKAKFTCIRADENIEDERIFENIIESIKNADIMIADITGNNPNVFYELGYSHAINKKVILITQDRKNTPFDIYGIRSIEYKPDDITSLSNEILRIIKVIDR